MSESTEQAAFFDWADWVGPRLPELRFMAHWPNGEKRDKRTAARLKSMGVRRGPPDVWLLVRRGDSPGMVFEFKAKGGKLTPEQAAWLAHLSMDGWRAGMYDDWQEAARAVCAYLGADASQFGL